MKEKEKKRFTPEEIRKQADEFFKQHIKPKFEKKCETCGHMNPLCYEKCEECNCQF